ncbi:MAG: hypothetical protein HT580_06490 [Dechloromonas sp.]|nr:MAG: hypothetical protein HT580_06490 [Dechloromonas sp.]
MKLYRYVIYLVVLGAVSLFNLRVRDNNIWPVPAVAVAAVLLCPFNHPLQRRAATMQR